MTTPSKIVIDADNGKLDAASKKSAGEVRKIADNMKDAGTYADRLGKSLTNRLVGLSSILKTVQSIGQEFSKIQDASASASTSSGGRATRLGEAFRSLGLGKGPGGNKELEGLSNNVESRVGNKSADELTQFVSDFASANKGSRRKPSAQDTGFAIKLFSTGLFSQDEIAEASKRPGGMRRLLAEIPAREGSLTEREVQERGVRQVVNNNSLDAERARAQGGGNIRAAQSGVDAALADSPNAAGVVGVLKGATSFLGGDAAIDAASTKLFMMMNGTLSEIAKNTKSQPKPNMQPTTESGP